MHCLATKHNTKRNIMQHNAQNNTLHNTRHNSLHHLIQQIAPRRNTEHRAFLIPVEWSLGKKRNLKMLSWSRHPWWSLSCLSTATRWLSAMRLTATAPGSIVIENNTVGSWSLWPSSSCHHHQSHQRHGRLWFINGVKISTMSSLLSVILIQNKLRRGKASRLGQSVQPWVDFCV